MKIFDSSGFMPHGHCFLWQPGVLWLHVLSDSLIALSYYSIPLALAYFVHKRTDLAFNWIFRLFAAFIFWCGTTHIFGIWVIWNPNYWLDGAAKAVTATVSFVTAMILWPLIPKALALPSPHQLEEANTRLQELNETLERRVAARTAELRHANGELEQFAHVVSHDLREPLRAIVSYSELIERKLGVQLDAATSKHFGYIIGGARRMQDLISDLLAYARVGQPAPQPLILVDSGRALDGALSNLKRLADETKAQITHNGLPPVRADSILLTQLFQNLVGNAIKYRRPGETPKVHVHCKGESGAWHFEVADNGRGIPPEQHERVFELFQRFSPDDALAEPGTGMGLAIAKKIVERWGGKIWVESQAGSGSVFHFTIPREPQA
ncbi:MAG: ATP-binding protein [Bdellovibrionota bacterium]